MVIKSFLRSSNSEIRPLHEASGLHSTIRRTLFSSRLIGLLPLVGLTHPTSDKLRFTLRTPYTIFYAVSIFGQALMFVFTFFWFIQNGISFSNVTNSIFYTSTFVSSLVLVNIGRFWPRFLVTVEAVESKLPPFSRNVARMANKTMIFILVAALVEHSLSVWYGITVAYLCDPGNLFETYCMFNMPWIFKYTTFSLWKGIFCEIFNLQSTFIWSYNDLLIMVLSIYLTEHFLINHNLLKRALEQERFSCSELRTQYLKIVHLVKLINGQFGFYILTSFASNLYFICTQLFYTLKKSSLTWSSFKSSTFSSKSKTGHLNFTCPIIHSGNFKTIYGIEHTIYFTYSFSFLMVRTLLVLLLAARIHSSSITPLHTLYDVPSSKYNVEVERFIAQINSIKVAMTGMDFFYVTRTMILTLLGTIVTYELVLLQFNK